MGIGGLTLGAELVVRGASRLALRLGVSSLFVGLTLVSFGTSLPELVVNVGASVRGVPSLAFGNVVGSNIFNVGGVLGVAALVSPLSVNAVLIRRETPLLIALTALLFLLGGDHRISRLEGALLVVGLLVYTLWAYRLAHLEGEPARLPVDRPARQRTDVWNPALILGGLLLLAISAHWVVRAAVEIADSTGLGPSVVGLTIVAAGTSLPELATSAVAAFRHEADIAVGNVLGSNIFNILGVLGATGLVGSFDVPARMMQFDIPVALALSIVCLPILASARRISRVEGILLLLSYVAYCGLAIGLHFPAL